MALCDVTLTGKGGSVYEMFVFARDFLFSLYGGCVCVMGKDWCCGRLSADE